jgi:hypothetical protein
MQTTILSKKAAAWKKQLARTGLVSKGVVYCLLGMLAFMAAFEISGQSDDKADKQGVFQFVQERTGGNIILALIAVGLLCYSTWRVAEAVTSNGTKKSMGKRIRYLFSGMIYLSLAFYAVKMLVGKKDSEGKNSTQEMVAALLDKPFGQWLVGIVALSIAAVGIYQAYYGISEKYKKHVTGLKLHSASSAMLLRSGKIGYVSRALVWLLIAFLLMKAALHSNSKEAGNTGNAFHFLETSPYGSYLLGILALGLICYGIFNFIRARYDGFE